MNTAYEIESVGLVAKTKSAIKDAADRTGSELTNVNARAAPKSPSSVARQPARGVFGGIPTFFRAACHTAAQGGASGYASAGWHLASSVGGQMPYDLTLDEWVEEIEVLQELAAGEDGRAVWDWFASHYPKAMALIPARRRERFAEGVRRAWEEERITA